MRSASAAGVSGSASQERPSRECALRTGARLTRPGYVKNQKTKAIGNHDTRIRARPSAAPSAECCDDPGTCSASSYVFESKRTIWSDVANITQLVCPNRGLLNNSRETPAKAGSRHCKDAHSRRDHHSRTQSGRIRSTRIASVAATTATQRAVTRSAHHQPRSCSAKSPRRASIPRAAPMPLSVPSPIKA